jgi:hypothetical protein
LKEAEKVIVAEEAARRVVLTRSSWLSIAEWV